MRVALCQYDIAWEDKEANKRKLSSLVDGFFRKERAGWLVFPEMTLSAFSMDPRKTTLAPEDKRFFADMARARSACVCYGGVEDGRNKLFALDEAGEQVAQYAKTHLFSLSGEDKAYKAGQGQATFQLGGLSVTPAVCFDLRFPYLFWGPARRTDVYVVIACWPSRRAGHWAALLRARAIENQAYVVGVNRVGKDAGGLEYAGGSMVVDPSGECVLDCKGAEGVFACEVGLEGGRVSAARARLPFLKDRRDWTPGPAAG